MLRWPIRRDLDHISAPSAGGAGIEDRIVTRVLALIEVAIVAVAGSLLARIVLQILAVPPDQIWEHTPTLFLFMVVEATITLILVLFFLRMSGESLWSLGWRGQGLAKESVVGVVSIPVLFGSTFLVGTLFHVFFPEQISKSNPLLDLVQTKTDLTLFLVSSVYVGGIKEEIQRAFVLRRFNRFLGSLPTGLILWSIFFGAGHAVQGIDNAVGAGVLGLLFGLLYLMRGSVVGPIWAHALYDMITLGVFWFLMR